MPLQQGRARTTQMVAVSTGLLDILNEQEGRVGSRMRWGTSTLFLTFKISGEDRRDGAPVCLSSPIEEWGEALPRL